MSKVVYRRILFNDDKKSINEQKKFDSKNILESNYNNVFSDIKNKEKIIAIGEVQSGKTKNLLYWVEEQLLKDVDITIILGGTNTNLLNQTNDRLVKELGDKFELFNKFKPADVNLVIKSINSGKKIIINAMKESYWLNELVNGLNSIHSKYLKYLIIDDECDYGSVNKKGKNETTKLNNTLTELWNLVQNGYLIFVTATPFENIRNKNNLELYPDRVVSLINNDNDYCGINSFDDNYIIKENQKMLVTNNRSELWNIIKETINKWLIMTVKMRSFKRDAKSQALFNIDKLTDNHNDVARLIDEYFGAVISTRPNFYEGFNSIEKEVYDELLRDLEYDKYIKVLNGKSKDSINTDKAEIIVGGNIVSRGVTFENVVIVVMLNSGIQSNNLSTIMQRCRWFGYRRKYNDMMVNRIEFMKIFISQEAYNILEVGKEVVEEMKKNKSISHLKAHFESLDCSTKGIMVK